MAAKLFVERVPNYVAGKWVESSNSEASELTNPATGERLGSVSLGSAEDVDVAVKAAQAAFPKWRDTPSPARARFMFDLRNLMEEHFEELSAICTQEHGKTLDESRGDVRRGIDNVETGAAMPSLMMGQALEQISSGIDCVAQRQPLGVFAAIAPYNFPAMVPLWFLPYCITTGNTMVIKPSEQVPLSQNRIFQLIDKLGLPPGVVNLVNGGRDVVNGIVDHPQIKGVSFVGSSPVAQHVYSRGTASGKRVQALGGAKNFIAVTDDADWDKAIPNLVESCYGCAGQRCLAGSTVIAIGDAYPKVVEKLTEGARGVKVGYGMDPGVTMGPVISAKHKEKVLGLIEMGIAEGARLALDGRGVKVDGHPNGHWVGPTLFTDVNPSMTIAQQEIFGPVMAILHAKDLDDALAIIDAHPLANAASIYTSSGKSAREFVRRVPAAMVGVNIGVAAPMSFFTFGGSKGSFFGDLKAHGRDSVSFYTDNKTAITRWW